LDDIEEPSFAVRESATVETGRRQETLQSFRDAMDSLAREAEHVVRTVRRLFLPRRKEVARRVDRLASILDGVYKLDSAGLERYRLWPRFRQDFSSFDVDRLVTDLLALGIDARAAVQWLEEHIVQVIVDKEREETPSRRQTAHLLTMLGHFSSKLKEIGKTLRAD
jgi:hypothetical protein